MYTMTEEEARRRQAELMNAQNPPPQPGGQMLLPRTYTNGGHWSGTNVPISDQDLAAGLNQASDRDVLGAGNYGVRGWSRRHPVGVIGAGIGLMALGGLAAGGLGGGAAGAAGGTGGGAAGGLGTAGAGTVGGGLGSTAGGALGGAGGLGMEGITVTGTAGGSGLGGALGAAGIGAGIGAAASGGMPSQEQILNQYSQENQAQLAQQPAPSATVDSGWDWKKLFNQQGGGASSDQATQTGSPQPVDNRKQTFIDRLQSGLGRIGENLFPIDQAYGMTPEQQKKARQAAIMQMGLGMMAASNNGARFGEAASFGLGQAQHSLTGALQQGYENARQARLDQRRDQLDQQEQQRYESDRAHQLEREKIADARYQTEADRSQSRWEAEQKATAEWRKANIDAENKRTDAMTAKSGASANLMTPEGLDYAAEQYYRTGKMPPLGNGSAALKAQIVSAAAQKAKDEGNSAVAAVLNAQANAANSSALTQISKQQAMVGAFEKNAAKNADIAVIKSAAVDRTGVPAFNRWVNAGRKEVAGDPAIAEFNAANETFVNEYAKVMSGSMGNTPVSDAAREHAHEMLSTAMTHEQYVAVINLLKQEMGNRMSGFDEEIGGLRQRMMGTGAPSNDGWTIQEVQ